MPEAFSEEWVAALHEAAQGDEALRDLARDRRAVIAHEVRDGERHHRWHFVLDHGEVAVLPGPAPEADIRIVTDRAVARAIAEGTRSAASAFVLGDIQVGGDMELLRRLGPAVAGVGDPFAAVRDDLSSAQTPPAPRA